MLISENGVLLYESKCRIRDTNLGKAFLGFPKDYTVLDLETTGLDYRNDLIIEFAGIKVRDFKIVDSFSSLCDPGFPIPYDIQMITHITDNMVKYSKNPSAVLPSFLDFVGSDFIIGHNVLFDVRFLGSLNGEFRNNFIDTMALFRKLHSNLPHHRLSDMVDFYNKSNKSAHRALSDCYATNDCYIAMKNEAENLFGNTDNFLNSL